MQMLTAAKAAKKTVSRLTAQPKNQALEAMASALKARQAEILSANERDLQAAQGHISEVMLDRLRLTPARVEEMCAGLRATAAQADTTAPMVMLTGYSKRHERAPSSKAGTKAARYGEDTPSLFRKTDIPAHSRAHNKVCTTGANPTSM